MTDIVFHEGQNWFNFRVAAVILSQDHLLVQHVEGFNFCFLPGGRVQLMESMEQALQRELREEFEVTLPRTRLLWTVENFFPTPLGRYHEICGYFLCEGFQIDQPFPLDVSWTQGKSTYYWTPLDSLPALPLVPSFLQEAVKALPAYAIHLSLNELA
ncbi:NUDIX hydrolase [Ktedonobacter robiniae]|uniref:Nudix hydrolase domain-containing protein n=1 Tax=Ktedonobacter robiniae TaxID=2778365 RepID=A0ABQ3V2N0_9CHLR|nr:NUDIX domain-containing protein [Ktedonobacter robiniae]GHO59243.1 hypothetical protein KSB_77180 [Ktedonobacter robiniae]